MLQNETYLALLSPFVSLFEINDTHECYDARINK